MIYVFTDQNINCSIWLFFFVCRCNYIINLMNTATLLTTNVERKIKISLIDAVKHYIFVSCQTS